MNLQRKILLLFVLILSLFLVGCGDDSSDEDAALVVTNSSIDETIELVPISYEQFEQLESTDGMTVDVEKGYIIFDGDWTIDKKIKVGTSAKKAIKKLGEYSVKSDDVDDSGYLNYSYYYDNVGTRVDAGSRESTWYGLRLMFKDETLEQFRFYLPADMIEENNVPDSTSEYIAAMDYSEEIDNDKAGTYILAMITFGTDVIDQFKDTLDATDSSKGNRTTMSDVRDFEEKWKVTAEYTSEFLDAMNKKIPNSQCKEVWELSCSFIKKLEDMAIDLSNWDQNEDGNYDGNEMKGLLSRYLSDLKQYDEKYIIPIYDELEKL